MPLFKNLPDALYQSVVAKRGRLARPPQQQQRGQLKQPALAISQQYARVLLQLPEILDPVFSLLDLKSLLAARLVCKRWAFVARCCLSLRLVVHVRHTNPRSLPWENRKELAQNLSTFDALEISFDEVQASRVKQDVGSTTSSGHESDLLDDLSTPTLRQELGLDQSRLRKLILRDTAGIARQLETWLTALPMLSHLELVDLISGTIRIDLILESLPNLTSVIVEYAMSGEVTWSRSKLLGPATFKLLKLILRHVKIYQPHLEALLTTLPGLRQLEIRFMRLSPLYEATGEMFNRQDFYHLLAHACPFLDSLHFSLFHRALTVNESLVLRDSFPALQELSLAGKDLYDSGTDARIRVLDHYANFLTKLEILCYTDKQTDRFLERLHQFLCNAEHLKHLVAPKVLYWTEYLDLEPVYEESIYYRPRSNVVPGSFSWKVHSKEWACRHLETLHLGFRAKFVSSTYPENSRIMFGYISRHCPRLKDVLITRSILNLTLDGGLCLMTRLQDLERLKIVSHTKEFRLDAADVSWIGHPRLEDTVTTKSIGLFTRTKAVTPALSSRQIRCGVAKIFELDDEWHSGRQRDFVPQRQQLSRKKPHNLKQGRKQHGKLLSAMTSSGTKSVIIPLKDPTESAYPCWPHLRSFVLAADPVHLFKSGVNVNLIQSLRPDIGFKVQQWER